MRVEKAPLGGIKIISEMPLARRLLIFGPILLLLLGGLFLLQLDVVGGDWGFAAATLGLLVAMNAFIRIVMGRISRRIERQRGSGSV